MIYSIVSMQMDARKNVKSSLDNKPFALKDKLAELIEHIDCLLSDCNHFILVVEESILKCAS